MDVLVITTKGNHTITSKPVLGQLDGATLLGIYNRVTGKATKKFETREKGVEQTWKALTDARKLAALPSEIDLTDGKAKPTEQPAPTPAPAPKGGKQPLGKPAGRATTAASAPKKVRKVRGYSFVLPVGSEQKKPKLGKRLITFNLLTRPQGATFEEVQKATGWDRKTAYEGIRLLHSYCGYGLRQDADGTIYVVGA